MKIYIASDHAGFKLKEYIKQNYLKLYPTEKIEWMDLGTNSEASVDYPDFSQKLCDEVLKDKSSLGVLVCGSGQGVAIKANRNKGIRAALCWDTPIAALSRMHNDANVICMGQRLIPFDLALRILNSFINTPFEGGRHQKRVDKFDC